MTMGNIIKLAHFIHKWQWELLYSFTKEIIMIIHKHVLIVLYNELPYTIHPQSCTFCIKTLWPALFVQVKICNMKMKLMKKKKLKNEI